MSDFTFELADSRTMNKIGELTRARDRSLSLALNRAGSLNMRLPLVDELSEQVEEVVSCVLVKRNREVVWSGPVWTIQETTPDQLDISCVGWLQTLEKRVSKYGWGSPLQYTATDAGDIAIDLLTRSNADNITGPNYVQPGDVVATQNRTKAYQPFSGILTEILSLSDLESGYDMAVDPVTRILNIYDKIGTVQSESMFGYGGAATSITRTSDTARMCNRIIVYSSVGWAQADNEVSQERYGVFEEAISLSDVKDITILQAFADAEIAVRSLPLRFHSFNTRAFNNTGIFVPRIFEHFSLGDSVFIKCARGRLQVSKQAARVFGLTLTFDNDSGQERITSLQTNATSS